MLEAGFKFVVQSKLYIWKRRKAKMEKRVAIEAPEVAPREYARLNSSKLRDLAWSLDVLDLSKHKDAES